MRALLNPCNYQVRGNRPGSTCQRCDRQRLSSAVGITHSQKGVDNRCFHNGHAYDLGRACCTAYYGICQILAILGQNQLSGLGRAYLEQHLIGADFGQIERVRARWVAGSCFLTASSYYMSRVARLFLYTFETKQQTRKKVLYLFRVWFL